MNELRRNRPAARGSAGDDGVTIVELMIALFVVMIVFAGLAATLVSSFSSIRNSEARVRAVALGNELVEEMATVPWNQLGMRIDDPDTDPDPEELDGELVVWLADSMNPAVAHPGDQQPITRDGREYQVERWVTLVDEDDQPALKRMVVIVTWDVDGRESTIRTEGLRAPEPDELFDLDIISFEVEAVNLEKTAMWLRPSDHTNQDGFTVTATLGIEEASVQLRFFDRTPTEVTLVGAVTPEGQETVREWSIGDHAYQFSHGRTTFTVFATGPEGQIASDTATLRFYEDLDVKGPDVSQGGEAVPAGAPIRVDGSGEFCEPVTVEVDVHGMTSGEAVPNADEEGGLRFRWQDDDEIVMGLLGNRNFGGRFSVGEGDIDGVQLPATLDPDDPEPFEVSFEIVAERLAPQAEFYDLDERDFTVSVEVVEC